MTSTLTFQPVPLDRVRQEARTAAQQFTNVNDACPYPFDTDEGRTFKSEFLAMRAALGAAPELKP